MTASTLTQPRTLPDGSWAPATLATLADRRDRLTGLLDGAGWSAEEAFGVLTATTEAVASAVQHGSTPGAEIAVAFRVTERLAEVAVLDRGGPGSLERPSPTTLSDEAECGRGLILMEGFADRLGICPAGSGTFVLMEFSRGSTGGAGSRTDSER
jgi:anti-sigma regulatory factor (Ser/Thr protein kinase)